VQPRLQTGCGRRERPSIWEAILIVHLAEFSYNPHDFERRLGMTRRFALLTFLLCLTTIFLADEHKSTVAANASFDKMKSLEGSWSGAMIEGGKDYPATARFKLVSDGSALMGWLGEGTPEEMVTVFHMDGSDLMATHYCGAHNQPRFTAVPGGNPNEIVFHFKDATNMGPHDGHMQGVTFIFDGPDHHIEDWSYMDKKGTVSTAHFDFKRAK
jgi:hypothetical protein